MVLTPPLWATAPSGVPDAVAALAGMGFKARADAMLVVDGEVPGRELIATPHEDGRSWNYAGPWGNGRVGFWGLVTVLKGLDSDPPRRWTAQDRAALAWLVVGSVLWLGLGVLLGVWSW